jgi:aminocarboxymuconate-semialdehyde decarboxylase
MRRRPRDYLRHIYYDCITYDAAALDYLIDTVGAGQVLFGTDWPHQVHDIAGSLAHTGALPADRRDAIRGANALKIFKL